MGFILREALLVQPKETSHTSLETSEHEQITYSQMWYLEIEDYFIAFFDRETIYSHKLEYAHMTPY